MARKPELSITEPLQRLLYIVRGQRVMLDSDLAEIYGVPTYGMNEQFGAIMLATILTQRQIGFHVKGRGLSTGPSAAPL